MGSLRWHFGTTCFEYAQYSHETLGNRHEGVKSRRALWLSDHYTPGHRGVNGAVEIERAGRREYHAMRSLRLRGAAAGRVCERDVVLSNAGFPNPGDNATNPHSHKTRLVFVVDNQHGREGWWRVAATDERGVVHDPNDRSSAPFTSHGDEGSVYEFTAGVEVVGDGGVADVGAFSDVAQGKPIDAFFRDASLCGVDDLAAPLGRDRHVHIAPSAAARAPALSACS